MDTTAVDPSARAAQVRALVEGLAGELNPGRRLSVHAHSSLERDLGFDSLARVELIARLERTFGVRLQDRVALDAERVSDLIRSVEEGASAGGRAELTERVAMPKAATETLPSGAETLIEALEWHAARHPERVQIWLYGEDGEVEELTFAALVDLARNVAGGLLERGVEPGQAVAIMLPTSRDFFAAFFGVLYAGAVPVPLYPPVRPSQVEEHLRRQAGILATAECPLMITVDEAKRLGLFLRSQVPGLRGLVTVEELSRAPALQDLPAIEPEATAFLQFTSGSTADPKGVVLSHRNLLANMRVIGEFVAPEPDDVFVSWLPLYHDMGLIGAVLTTLYHGVPLVLMSPLAFLLRPERWLRAIHRHRGTLSAAPNFAYELCVKKIAPEVQAELDLSSWRMSLNGAEPIVPATLKRFADHFAPQGLRPEVLTPTYGLAECSLALAMSRVADLPKVDRIERGRFSGEGRAEPSASADALEFVSCGAALPGHEIRIVDSGGRELAERREGRLQFRGPSATSGYFRNEAATESLLTEDAWLDSGDLAYVAEGEVYLTGRIKDVIIRAGRNIYPHELEEAVGALEGVRKGCVAVFGARTRGETEELVVVAETREEDPGRKRAIEESIREVAQALLGTPPERVLLAPPHTVLKTSSGKLRRAATRKLYEEGRLLADHEAPWIQFARLSAEGAWFAAKERVRDLKERAWSTKFWAAFAPSYLCAWGLSATLPTLGLRWRGARACAKAFLFVAGVDVEVRGRERLAGADPSVLVANHSSYLDGVLIPVILPEPSAVVAKKELRGSALTRVLLERLGAVFVERFRSSESAEDAEAIPAVLGEGRSVLVFPEGTCLRMPGLLPFRLGAFQAAARTGVPVIPITIRGTRSVLRPTQWFAHQGRIEVEIGEPIQPAGSDFQGAVGLRDAARAAILAAVREPDLGGEDAFETLRSD
jgi:1-acyl-sn-glycerol-3-phosphate acyltransferase